MTEIAREFLVCWIGENIASLTHADGTEAKGSARMCVADAEQNGISYSELEDTAAGDLVAFMAGKNRRQSEKRRKELPTTGAESRSSSDAARLIAEVLASSFWI